MSARVLKYTLVVRNPDTLVAVPLLAGKPVPKWAKDLVHSDDLVSGSDTSDDEDTTDPTDNGDGGGGIGADGDDDGSDGGDGGDGGDPPADWSKRSVADLKAEVDRRNQARDEADQIEVEAPGNKPQLVAALDADDAA